MLRSQPRVGAIIARMRRRSTHKDRFGTPETERARPQLKLRLLPEAVKALDVAADREHCTRSELVERWCALGCPMPKEPQRGTP